MFSFIWLIFFLGEVYMSNTEIDSIRNLSSITMTSVPQNNVQTSDAYGEIMAQAKNLQNNTKYLRPDDFSATSSAQAGGAATQSDFRISSVPSNEFSPTSSYNRTNDIVYPPTALTEITYGNPQNGGVPEEEELNFSDLSFSSLLTGGADDDDDEEGDSDSDESDSDDEDADENDDDDASESSSDVKPAPKKTENSKRSFITGTRRLPTATNLQKSNNIDDEPGYVLSESPLSSFGSEWDATTTTSEYSTVLRA